MKSILFFDAKTSKIYLIIFVSLFLLLIGSLIKIQIIKNKPLFYEKEDWQNAVAYARANGVKQDEHVNGGILPHHFLSSSPITADFFYRLSLGQKIDTFIILGPNHEESGDRDILSSLKPWQTPLGKLAVNEEIVNKLKDEAGIGLDEQVLKSEYSISFLVHFIRYYFPDSTIVPLIFKLDVPQEKAEMLGRILSKYLNNNVILISSLDFSHFLTDEEAEINDEIVKKAIQNFDFNNFYNLDNPYLSVESPAALVALLTAMKEIESTNVDIIHEIKSHTQTPDKKVWAITYFSIFFSR